MSKRRSITKAMRVRIFDKALGRCHLCKLAINATLGERWEVEHVKPLWEGGMDGESNMAPAHIDCHATKSKGEAAPRAKTTRQRANALGVDRPAGKLKSASFPHVVRPHADRGAAMGVSEIARRYGIGETQ